MVGYAWRTRRQRLPWERTLDVLEASGHAGSKAAVLIETRGQSQSQQRQKVNLGRATVTDSGGGRKMQMGSAGISADLKTTVSLPTFVLDRSRWKRDVDRHSLALYAKILQLSEFCDESCNQEHSGQQIQGQRQAAHCGPSCVGVAHGEVSLVCFCIGDGGRKIWSELAEGLVWSHCSFCSVAPAIAVSMMIEDRESRVEQGSGGCFNGSRIVL